MCQEDDDVLCAQIARAGVAEILAFWKTNMYIFHVIVWCMLSFGFFLPLFNGSISDLYGKEKI